MEHEILYAQISLLPFAVGAGASLLSGLFGGGSKPSEREKRLKGRFDTLTGTEGREARDSRQAQRDFDASAAVRESTLGAFNILKPEFQFERDRLVGSAVGQGRLRTGFLTEDQGRLDRQQKDRLADFASRQAVQAAGLNLRNITSRARAQDRFPELITGGIDQELNEREARDRRRQAFAGSLGRVGGFLGGGLFNRAPAAAGGGRNLRNT